MTQILRTTILLSALIATTSIGGYAQYHDLPKIPPASKQTTSTPASKPLKPAAKPKPAQVQPTPAPVNNLRHPAEPDMVFVKGGTFWMGCTDEQVNDCMDDERPLHSVTVSSFYIGKYEVTQKQWQLIMGTSVRQLSDKDGLSLGIYGEGDNYPMYYVNWDEAQEFIRRLNAATGKQYRLATEAEWEFACRGGLQSAHYKYSGSNNPNDVAWYQDNSNNTTHSVGTKSPNELGIYDMSGNVGEWCQDWYGDYPSSPQRDYTGPSSGSRHVIRGGGWSNGAEDVRASSRNSENNGVGMTTKGHNGKVVTSYNIYGFRLACSSN